MREYYLLVDDYRDRQRMEDLRAFRLYEAITGLMQAFSGQAITIKPGEVFPSLADMDYRVPAEDDPELTMQELQNIMQGHNARHR